MIHNSLFNPRFGRGLAPALVSTLTELRRCDLPELAPGHHPIDGDNIFMDVMTLTTTPAAQKRAEMHQEYIALHLLISGEERIEYGLAGDGHREQPHAENSDLLLLDIKRHPQTLHMTHGMFAIFPNGAAQNRLPVAAAAAHQESGGEDPSPPAAVTLRQRP